MRNTTFLPFTLLAAALLAGCPDSDPAPPPPPPSAPTGLTATPYNGAVGLAWNAVADATTYNVYQSDAAGQPLASMTLAGSGVTATAFNAACTNDVPQYFRVTAVNAGGESSPSGEVSATALGTLLPAAPAGLKATAGNQSITLEWGAVPGATSYKIYWRTTAGVTTGDLSITCASSPCTHPGRTNGTTYYYAATALITATESALSNEVSATPAALPYIDATLVMLPPSLGNGDYEVQVCTSASCATPITDATVQVNGVTLTYDGTDTYVGAPAGSIAGARLQLTVIVPSGAPAAAGTYTGNATMYTAGPSLTAPVQGGTWLASTPNTFTWTEASPTASSMYSVTAFVLFPTLDFVVGMVAPPTTNYVVGANTMTPGSWTAVAQITSTASNPIPNAAAGSGISLSAASDMVTFTVQ